MDSVSMVRKIRENVDAQYKDLPLSEMARRIHKEVEKDPKYGPMLRRAACTSKK